MQQDVPTKARAKILLDLKTRGPQSASEIARRLGVTAMAVRQHLYQLQEDGVVAYRDERRKVGRPARIWHLTDNTNGHFPDSHGELAVGILGAARKAFGDDGIARLIDLRNAEQAERYRKSIGRRRTLEDKVAELARIRSQEGYMAEWRRDDDGSLLLIENHCPICAAAESCQDLCRGELQLFNEVLGSAEIVREEHILTGERRCLYRIKPRRKRA